MEFTDSNKLKGYLKEESKRLEIHSNYAYTYYFLRSFLKRLMQNHSENFVLKGSLSALIHTKSISRPITDLDIVSHFDLIESSYIIEKTIANNDDIKFKLKEKFITTNKTANFRILCNFDRIEHLIKLDLKKENSYKKIVKDMPIILKKDTQFKVVTISKEQHIANKMYVILKNAEANNTLNKEMRRFKDFYDFYFLVKDHDFDEQEVRRLLNANFERYGEIKRENLVLESLNDKFIRENFDRFLYDKDRFGFKDISFEELVNTSREEIKKSIM